MSLRLGGIIASSAGVYLALFEVEVGWSASSVDHLLSGFVEEAVPGFSFPLSPAPCFFAWTVS